MIDDGTSTNETRLGAVKDIRLAVEKLNLAVPPFYCYRACDVKRIQEALDNGCGYDAPGSFAAWLSRQRCTLMLCRVSGMTLAILTAMSM